MLVGLDSNGNRLYADTASKEDKCFCPYCDEQLILKKGQIRVPYFSHRVKSDCIYNTDKDYKSEWHIRMQNYFPRESLEVRFIDENTKERHIADVFLTRENIVIEFQHSPIQSDEFYSRSLFHINNGRKVIWVFDESKENPKENDKGRLRPEHYSSNNWIYKNLYFKWIRNPRSFLIKGLSIPNFYQNCAIYIYNGCEGDSIRRVLDQNDYFEYVLLSFKAIEFNKITNYIELTYDDSYWAKQEPYKSIIDEQNNKIRERNQRINERNKIAYQQLLNTRRNKRNFRF